jgi:hypothetical protein
MSVVGLFAALTAWNAFAQSDSTCAELRQQIADINKKLSAMSPQQLYVGGETLATSESLNAEYEKKCKKDETVIPGNKMWDRCDTSKYHCNCDQGGCGNGEPLVPPPPLTKAEKERLKKEALARAEDEKYIVGGCDTRKYECNCDQGPTCAIAGPSKALLKKVQNISQPSQGNVNAKGSESQDSKPVDSNTGGTNGAPAATEAGVPQ